jgi:hypothetical protein
MHQLNISNIKKICFIFLILLGIIIIKYFSEKENFIPVLSSFKTNHAQSLDNDIVNCEFEVISNFFYENREDFSSKQNRKIYYETNKESKPSVITFINLNTKSPQMKGNLGSGKLVVLKNDKETIVLAEQNTFGDIFTYTIFKKEKIAVWQKTYKLISNPYSMNSMGYCY